MRAALLVLLAACPAPAAMQGPGPAGPTAPAAAVTADGKTVMPNGKLKISARPPD